MTKKRTKRESYSRMTAAELAQATREYDRGGSAPRFLQPPRRAKARHDAIIEEIRRKRGRPVVGEGAQRIQVTMERSLLSRADACARRLGVTRAQLIARGVEEILRKAG